MGGLVSQHAVIIHAVRKLVESGHVDRFGSIRAIESAIAAVTNLNASSGEECVSVGDSLVTA